MLNKHDSPVILAEFRKVNCILNFFETHYGSVENCEYFAVRKSALEDLSDRVDQTLSDHSLAEALLPTQGGFFFGSTNYDEWYFESLKELKKFLDSDVVQNYDEDETQIMLFCWW